MSIERMRADKAWNRAKSGDVIVVLPGSDDVLLHTGDHAVPLRLPPGPTEASSVLRGAPPTALDEYRALQREADRHEAMIGAIHDRMDPLWARLTPEERAEVNRGG